MKINIDRLMREIENYAIYGKDENGGITRPSFSDSDYEVRKLFQHQLEQMGLAVTVDPIANIWGKFQADKIDAATIVIGSHLDTVPNGGKYDGTLGVLIAKEIIQTLIDHNITMRHHIKIVSFTAEESNEFNYSTMGSRVFTGKLKESDFEQSINSRGLKLSVATKKAGGDISKINYMTHGNIAAYLEVHIEQGRKLEKEKLSVGIVDNIVGVYRETITIEGEQNHSGTTTMEERKDALVPACEMVASVHKLAKSLKSDTVATIGKFNVHPNATNVIPGRVEFTLEIRSADKTERESLIAEVHQSFNKIKDFHHVKFSSNVFFNHQECSFDQQLIEALEASATSLNIPYAIIPSMAGHDAMHLAEMTKSAMLFIRSAKGISHNPEEYSCPEDIEQGANVLLHTLLNIDQELSSRTLNGLSSG